MPYAGLPDDLPRFLTALEANNDRDWFEANRFRYEASYLEAGEAFVAAVSERLHELSPHAVGEPVNGSIKRLYRDTRFSKDKTPYKTWLGMFFWDERQKQSGFYLQVTAGQVLVGGGRYDLDKEGLAAFRAKVDTDGDALASILSELQTHGLTGDGPDLKRVPRGFDKEHPHGELLKHKRMIVGRTIDLPDELFGADAVDWLLEQFRPLRPLVYWLAEV